MGRRKEKKDKLIEESPSKRQIRVAKENKILEEHGAKFHFQTWTRFANRYVAKEDGYIREPGFVKDRVYWIVEAWEGPQDEEEEEDGGS